jgi:hypothetical protein
MNKWERITEKEKSYTKEMEDFFYKRTNKHIELVQKYCKKIDELNDPRFEGILKRGECHDQSKLKEPEKEPYIHIGQQCQKKREPIVQKSGQIKMLIKDGNITRIKWNLYMS